MEISSVKENKSTPALNYVIDSPGRMFAFQCFFVFCGHTMFSVSGRNSVKVNKFQLSILETLQYNLPRQTSNLVNASLPMRQPLYGRANVNPILFQY